MEAHDCLKDFFTIYNLSQVHTTATATPQATSLAVEVYTRVPIGALKVRGWPFMQSKTIWGLILPRGMPFVFCTFTWADFIP